MSAPAANAGAAERRRQVDAFDADVLIYAATTGHELGAPVRDLFLAAQQEERSPAGVGSVMLIPELLTKPLRDRRRSDARALAALLARLELLPVDEATARLAAVLGAKYRLRAADGVHLATAVSAGATRFITSNRRDFPRSIDEIDVTYPPDLERGAHAVTRTNG